MIIDRRELVKIAGIAPLTLMMLNRGPSIPPKVLNIVHVGAHHNFLENLDRLGVAYNLTSHQPSRVPYTFVTFGALPTADRILEAFRGIKHPIWAISVGRSNNGFLADKVTRISCFRTWRQAASGLKSI